MQATTGTRAASPAQVWVGRALSGLVIVFLAFDSIIKLMGIQPVADSFKQLGYPLSQVILIGVIDLACCVLYAIPQTAVLGAVLLTGLLGGAIASHVRIESPLFSHTLFGVYLGLMAWAGLYLRETRLRALLPLRTPGAG